MSTSARLALGTAQLGLAYGIANRRGRPTDREADAILSLAFERGVRCLDTAAAYGDAESRIGEFLGRRGRPPGLVLCSKLSRLPRGLAPREIDRAIGEAVDASRQRLRSDIIDVYLVHDASDLVEYGPALGDALARRVAEGAIGRAGTSVYGPEETRVAFGHPVLRAIQYPFNAFDRRMAGANGAARDGVATFARSPLLQGLLAMAPEALPSKLSDAAFCLTRWTELCRDHGVTSAAAALAFAAEHSGADHVVLGAESAEQVGDALDALETRLPEGLGAAIDREISDVPARVIDPRRWE